MSHFAKVEEGVVVQVIVAEQDFINTLPDKDSWVQTSYNTRGGIHYTPDSDKPDEGEPLRKNFAGVGFTYDLGRDAFIPVKPYPSWALNESTCLWDAPTPMPQDGLGYSWDEDTLSWCASSATCARHMVAPVAQVL